MQNPNKTSENQYNYSYSEMLETLGLNKTEAQIYELLLKAGATGIKPLLVDTGLKRGNAYYHLDSLIAKGLVEKIDLPKQPVKFLARHPENLELLVAQKKAALANAQDELSRNLPDMRSLFQLIAVRPGVKFYEGLEGAIKIVNDSLTSSTEILSYIDSESLNRQFPDINTKFILERKEKFIKKRILAPESAFIHKHARELTNQVTQVRTINSNVPFSTIMYIYDNRVAYISKIKNEIIGMVIENPAIYQMHKILFETMWQTAKAA